jgi:nucleoside-diphosphate-sugar epimerase
MSIGAGRLRCGGDLRVLVTGVSGFVGGELGRHLRVDCGHHVLGISRRPPRDGSVDEFRPADLSAPLPADLGRLDAIVHAAALVTPWARPSDYERANVAATANVLAFAHRAGAPHLVLISSSSVLYAPGDQLGLSEATPLPAQPINAYAASKRRAEALVVSSGLDAAILRPRAVFGAGDTVLFPRILRAARSGLLPRFTRPDGSRAIGDLVSIDNLVRFIAAALERRVVGDFNLTDGQPVDIYGFLGTVLGRLGLPPPSWSLPASIAMPVAGALEAVSRTLLGWREPPLTRYGVGVFSQCKTFDITKAKLSLGAPRIATAEAVDRFVAWQKAQMR